MLRLLAGIFFLLVSVPVFSQTVRFEIHTLPAIHPAGSAVYIAGSFNGWNPQDEKYRFQTDTAGKYFLQFSLPFGKYEYKITRGGWDKVESFDNGTDIANRALATTAGDTYVSLAIVDWKDNWKTNPKRSTASKNVQVMDTSFFIPQLNRSRRIWVYLPENYHTGPKEYRWPVLYMHDGQNVFDASTSFAGEWGIDEYFDSTGYSHFIIVAIDNGGDKRMNEYSPFDNTLFGKGEGAAYTAFIVKTLKPHIDRKFRTLKDRKNTHIMGSSMGGLISLYAALKYPSVFGGAGIFSPSIWLCKPEIMTMIKARAKKVKANLYFYCGKQEAAMMVSDALGVFDGFINLSRSSCRISIKEEGKHNEEAWRKELPSALSWIKYGSAPKIGSTIERLH